MHNTLKIILISLNILAAVALIFSILAGHISPSRVIFFASFGLFYPIILFSNLFFILFWAVLRSYWVFLSLFFVFIGFTNLTNNFPLNFFKEQGKSAKSINLISYNVQNFGLPQTKAGSAKFNQGILDFIKNNDPDIICLQEYQSRDQQLYEPLKELKNELHAGTYYFESYFNPRFNEYLTGLVIFSNFEAVNKGKLKFEGSRTFGIYTDLLINADTVRVYNIHLASIQLKPDDIDFVVNPDVANDTNLKGHYLKIYKLLSKAFLLREKQVNFLLSQLKECSYPVILCGDFNDTPSSFTYHQVTNLLDDTFVEKGSGMSWTYGGQIPFLRIDYILKTPEFNTLAYKNHQVIYSDHFPLSVALDKK